MLLQDVAFVFLDGGTRVIIIIVFGLIDSNGMATYLDLFHE